MMQKKAKTMCRNGSFNLKKAVKAYIENFPRYDSKENAKLMKNYVMF